MRLLVTVLAAAALSSQHAASAQCSPQCSCGSPDGSWSPLYRILTPSANDIVPRVPSRCSCGCSPHRLPPRLPTAPRNNAQQSHGVSSLSGVVMDSPVFQQVGPATAIQTPPAMYVSSPDVQGSSSHSCDTSSHIMTIPRKQDSSVTFNSYETPSDTITTFDEFPPTVTYYTEPNARPAEIFSSTPEETPTTTYSTTPQHMPSQPPPTNSVMLPPQTQPHCPSPPAPQPMYFTQPPPSNSVVSAPQTLCPPPQPQPMYFTQPAPLFASCPATLFYPTTPPMTCPQPNFIYPGTPSYPSAPAIPTVSQSPTPGTSFQRNYLTTDNTPTTTYSVQPSQNTPCNAPQAGPSPPQTFTTSNLQNTPSNTVTFSMSEIQQLPTTTYSMPHSHDVPCNAPQAGPNPSQTFATSNYQNSPSNYVTSFSTSDTQQIPTTTYSMPHSHDVPCNAPQAGSSPSQTFTTSNPQNIPSDTVTFSTSDNQQTPTHSVNFNTNFQQAPSNTVVFSDSSSSAGAGTLQPHSETKSPTVTNHNSPLTYTLLTSGTNKEVTDANRDCSVPVPPVLV